MSRSELGTFLQARRAAVQPPAGLASHTSRRVTGLRREEVALLAGVSVDYYARLEQGREKSPSAAVLNALAGVLTPDEDARAHLFRLAGLAHQPSPPPGDAETVDRLLRELLASWPDTPAVIHNRQLDLLAGNELATALYSDFEHAGNLVRMTFLDPAGRRFFVDWARAAEGCVANLRLALGYPQEDVQTLVKEVYGASADFRRLWDRHDAYGKTHEAKQFHHSVVGDLTLDYLAFDVRSRPELQLVVYRAAPGTPSAAKLQRLRHLDSTAPSGPSAAVASDQAGSPG